MLILDTDLLSIIQRAEGREYARIVARLPADEPHSVYITVVTVEEQTRGWLAQIGRARTPDNQIIAYARFRACVQDVAGRNILDFDAASVLRYQQLVKEKVRIGTMDLKIAAISLAHGAKLLSRNLSDFQKVPGLLVEDWSV